jgi:DNA repair protein RadC
MNSKGKTLGYRVIGMGRMHSTPVDIRLIASLALHTLATCVIVAHNHSSGDLMPSENDLNTTKRVKNVLKLIDVILIDHLIISNRDHFSMSNMKLI